ncbi:leucine-rich PPR motif-containing protein mitochondrial-like isoform X1 [Biomphalaria glabrata]
MIENMHEETLVAQRRICDFLKVNGGVLNVAITKPLLTAAASGRQNYHQYLEKEKTKKAEMAKNLKRKRHDDELSDLKAKRKKLMEEDKFLRSSADKYADERQKQNKISSFCQSLMTCTTRLKSSTLNILKALSEGKFSCEEKFSNVDSVKTILIEAPSIKDAETLHEAIIKHKAVETSEVQKVHQFYVSRILMLSDDDEVVRYLMRLHKHYHVFPSGEKILKRFIEKKDVDRLKRVMDVGLHVFGNNYLHHLLAFSFLQSGLANKAAVIFQTPGLKLNERLILDKCQYYIKMRKVDWLSELVNITRTLPISRTQMLKHLAQGYIATQDLTKATSVIRTFLDDFIEPPKNLVRDIVRLYQNANQELPEILKPYEQVEKKQPRSEVNQSSTDEKTDDIKII